MPGTRRNSGSARRVLAGCGTWMWHLDEVFARVGGKQVYRWRAVDEHGPVLDVLLQAHRDTAAAERFFRRLLGHVAGPPDQIVTDSLASYGAAKARLPERTAVEHRRVRAAARRNTRGEQSHQPTRLRDRPMPRVTSVPSAQRLLAAVSRCCNHVRHVRVRRHLRTTGAHRTVRHTRDVAWRALVLVAKAT